MLTQINDALEALTGRRLMHEKRDERLFARLQELRTVASQDRGISLANRFARFVCDNYGRGKGQFFQDLWVLFELQEKQGGFFVEFGATDGVGLSNTWLLEKEYGWSGILAEPNPIWHQQLRINRSAVVEDRCVYTVAGSRLEFHATKLTGFSTISHYSGADLHAASRQDHRSLTLATVSLDDLLNDHSAPAAIDYGVSLGQSNPQCCRLGLR